MVYCFILSEVSTTTDKEPFPTNFKSTDKTLSMPFPKANEAPLPKPIVSGMIQNKIDSVQNEKLQQQLSKASLRLTNHKRNTKSLSTSHRFLK